MLYLLSFKQYLKKISSWNSVAKLTVILINFNKLFPPKSHVGAASDYQVNGMKLQAGTSQFVIKYVHTYIAKQ